MLLAERMLRIFVVALFAVRSSATPEHLVCVCSGTLCDEIEPLGAFDKGTAILYRTEKATGKRMDRSVVKLSNKPYNKIMTFDDSKLFQEVIGFGGSFTNAAGINIASLPKETQDILLQQYFGPTGAEYTIGRIPFASTDFSTRIYSYCDKADDFNLTTFALAEEVEKYKATKLDRKKNDNFEIPFIRRALELQKSTGGLKLFASPWSAPGWMKSSGMMKGGGRYYVTYAQYFVKFLEAYAARGVAMWAVTIQNEPSTGVDPTYPIQTMLFTAEMERNFIKGQLGPALQASAVGKDVKIIIVDDGREFVAWGDIIYKDEYVSSLCAGTGVHWYDDKKFPADLLTEAHEKHSDKFILATEDMNNYAAGWIDWNLILDIQGGPNWAKNNVDAPILVDATAGEFLKQPMFYAMAHFSKFIKPGSHRAALKVPDGLPGDYALFDNEFEVTALGIMLKDKKRVVVVLNRNGNQGASFSIEDASNPGTFLNIDMPPHSIVTAIWNGE